MKKIYLSLLTAFICGSVIAQSAYNVALPNGEGAKLSPNTKAPVRVQTQRGGPFSQWVEPIGDIMTNKGLLLDGSAGADQALFLGAVYMDSTTKVSSATSTRNISSHFYGTVLDPKSTQLQTSFDPIVTYADAYTLDSVVVLGSYVKVTPDVDTLYVTIVWGDTNNTAVWKKTANASVWAAPIGTWRNSIIGPLLQGASGSNGNLVSAAAPSTNQMLIKYALTTTDSSQSGRLKYINIPLSAPISVPADNIVSCIVTFVPGGTHALGDVSYGFTGGSPQTVNGFGLAVWNQKNPAVTSVASYLDHQVDASSMCMGNLYQKGQRYATAGWNGLHDVALGYLVSAPVILYKISGTSTVGVNELNGGNFSLGQNTPNPFDNKSIINYSLKNDAKDVAFVIYDVRGAKVFENKELDNTKGTYSIELNNANLNSGLYFYSLTVDGKSVTKKMVVTK